MNGRKHPRKRLIAAMLAALLIGQLAPAYAVEPDGEPETPPQATESHTAAPDDVGVGNDTPEAENPVEGPEMGLVVVSTLEELLQAIDEAEAGATIGLAGLIDLEPDTILGSPDKMVTIQRVDTGSNTGFQRLPDQPATGIKVQNITFDGANIDNGSLFAISGDITFVNVTFQNCRSYGTTVGLDSGDAIFTNCVFDNNRGSVGAHLLGGGLIHLKGCTLTNGYSTHAGGAIQTGGLGSLLNIENCTITGNHADDYGGGIYNPGGVVNITQSKIYKNDAGNGGSDIWSMSGGLYLNDDLDTLKALFDEDTPEGWFYEFPDNPPELPFSGTVIPIMLKLTFTEPAPVEPEPEEPDPTPTPEPDPEPSPEPTPTPEPATPSSYWPSSGHSRPAVTVEEEPKEITLTNGRAVLKAPEGPYWAGYFDGHAGGAGSLTRAELALLIVSMMDSPTQRISSGSPFDDVDAGSPYAAAIGTTFSTGIMVGYGNGRFGPDRVLTWAELITVFSRFAGDDIPPEVFTGQHWAKDAINTAISLGWLEYSEAFDPGGVVTCGEAVDFIQTVFQWASD